MPELSFVLPHWLYWCGLVLFPIAAMLRYRRARGCSPRQPVSLGLGYFLLLTGGFIGVRRLYLKSCWALGIALLLGMLFDMVLIPRLVRRRNEIEGELPEEGFQCPSVEREPAMVRRSYHPTIACGSILAGGTLGILIPPPILALPGPAGHGAGNLRDLSRRGVMVAAAGLRIDFKLQ